MNLTASKVKLGRGLLTFDEVHSGRIICQTADALSRLKSTRIEITRIEDDIKVLCITSFVSPKNERRRLNMPDYNELKGKECVKIFAVYVIATTAETECDKVQKSAHEFIQDQEKDSYGLRASSTIRLLASTIIDDANGFSGRTAPIDEAVQKRIPICLEPLLLYH